MHVYVGQSCDLHQPQYLPTSATTLANTGTCIGQSCGLCRPQHLFTSANTGTCIGHITCIYMSATIPVYVGQSCDLHRPQYVPTSATTSVYVGQHWDLRRPQYLFTLARAVAYIGHIIVPATGRWHSWIPGVPGSSRHSVMALCDTLAMA